MSKSVYMRRNGGLTFWRCGRLGGSFYFARRQPRRAQLWRIIPARAQGSASYGPTLRRVRSLGDLGGAILGALYGASMAFGAALAAVAMWH